jgi:hypothetical protein
MQPNFPGILYRSRGRSTSTFSQKKIKAALATGYLGNWPIGLQYFKILK